MSAGLLINLIHGRRLPLATSSLARPNLYIVFQIYFDFMRHMHLPPYRQLAWSLLHLPFHLATALFIQGSSQFVIWWKLKEIMTDVYADFENALLLGGDSMPENVTDVSGYIAGILDNTTAKLFLAYPPKYQDTWISSNESITAISEIPLQWWMDMDSDLPESDPKWAPLLKPLSQLSAAIENSLFATFKYAGYENVKDATADQETFELEGNANNWGKFYLVVTYAFICAGLTLVFMNILFIFSRTRQWSAFNYVRAGTNFLVGIALCLVALIILNSDHVQAFTNTPWLLPTICLTFFFILVLNHLPKKTPFFFSKRHAVTD